MDFQGRQKKLGKVLADHNLDALLVTHLPNIHYLCGFTGSSGSVLLTESKSVFFTDGRYATQAKEEIKGAKVVIDRVSPLTAAAKWLKSHKPRGKTYHLGIEGEHLTVAARDRLAKDLPAFIRVKAVSSLVEDARMRKAPEEIEKMKISALLGVRLFDRILQVLKPGVKEKEVAAELEYAATQAGAEGMSFSTIIAAGERSALPHGRASSHVIPPAGFVVCDFGVILASYCSDMTRTVHVGNPGDEARLTYEAVLEAQLAAIDAVKPGTTVGEVDESARKILKKKKLEKYFTHSTGHGVGLEIHESPRIASGQTQVLEPGMVITIEPGVYLPSKWGIRIEDMVVVTEGGCEILTPASKELMVV